MVALARGIVETVRALTRVDPQIVPVHVDATDLFETRDFDLHEEAARRQEIVFLALDLVSGRVDERHALWAWLLQNGAKQSDLAFFLANPVDLPLIGLNLYPMFTQKRLLRDPSGRFRIRMPYADGELLTRLGRLYYQRYGTPIFVSETASMGSVSRRQLWMDQSIAAVKQLRSEGVPLVGYTWWPMFALVAWAYRQGRKSPGDYLVQMGLWNLGSELERVRTPLVDSFKGYVAVGSQAVGELVKQTNDLAVR
jgi:hypothetical protein